MNIHFIDTSVFTNILNVPNMSDERKKIMAEFKKLVDSKEDYLILPYATIIETGNHIAHNGDGRQRRQVAERFSECLLKTIKNQAPWQYYGRQLTEEDLEKIGMAFPDAAMREQGIGDLSIIRAYERYRDETPGISKIRIWTLDQHLMPYNETIDKIPTRNQ